MVGVLVGGINGRFVGIEEGVTDGSFVGEMVGIFEVVCVALMLGETVGNRLGILKGLREG